MFGTDAKNTPQVTQMETSKLPVNRLIFRPIFGRNGLLSIRFSFVGHAYGDTTVLLSVLKIR